MWLNVGFQPKLKSYRLHLLTNSLTWQNSMKVSLLNQLPCCDKYCYIKYYIIQSFCDFVKDLGMHAQEGTVYSVSGSLKTSKEVMCRDRCVYTCNNTLLMLMSVCSTGNRSVKQIINWTYFKVTSVTSLLANTFVLDSSCLLPFYGSFLQKEELRSEEGKHVTRKCN